MKKIALMVSGIVLVVMIGVFFRGFFHHEDDIEVSSISRHPRAVDYAVDFPNQHVGYRDKLPEYNHILEIDIRSTSLLDADLTNNYEQLINASFDSKTIWPEKLPDNFNPDEIMDLYKNPGLNVRSLHERGITGKGVGIGIIDLTLLVDHIEYKNQIKYYKEHRENPEFALMHGAAVASIAVGKSVGVAPGADLYYIAEDFSNEREANGNIAEDINELLDLNKNLPTKHRIRVISISWGMDDTYTSGKDKLEDAYARAKKEGVLIITTSISSREGMDFYGLNKIPLSDPDDYNTYTENVYSNGTGFYKISVPMSFRTLASPTGVEDYVVYSQGGLSWSAPYIAGLYALACQVKADISYEEFWKIASETSRSSRGEYNGANYSANYIVDPVAILDKLKD